MNLTTCICICNQWQNENTFYHLYAKRKTRSRYHRKRRMCVLCSYTGVFDVTICPTLCHRFKYGTYCSFLRVTKCFILSKYPKGFVRLCRNQTHRTSIVVLRLFPRILDFCSKKIWKIDCVCAGVCLQPNPLHTTLFHKISQKFLTRFPNTWRGGCLFFSVVAMYVPSLPRITSLTLNWFELNWEEKKRNESIKHRKKAAHKPITFFVIKCSP